MRKNKKAKKIQLTRVLKPLIYAVLVLFCLFVFIIYGKKQRSIESSATPSPEAAATPNCTAVVTPSPIPRIFPQELINGLQASGLDCRIAPRSTLEDGSTECLVTLNRISGTGKMLVKPDASGGTAEVILEFGYIYTEILDDPETNEVAKTLKEEYELREKYDSKLIDAFIRALAELFADEEQFNSVDLEKLVSGTVSAYKNMKTYDRYLGDIHFYISTELTDCNASVKLIAAAKK